MFTFTVGLCVLTIKEVASDICLRSVIFVKARKYNPTGDFLKNLFIQ